MFDGNGLGTPQHVNDKYKSVNSRFVLKQCVDRMLFKVKRFRNKFKVELLENKLEVLNKLLVCVSPRSPNNVKERVVNVDNVFQLFDVFVIAVKWFTR